METALKHPCFDIEAKKKYGRVHLPVAPKCNVQCNYCNRKYDCVNESRPGVCSAIISPEQSIIYLHKINNKGVPLGVVGIAGPGDPLANPDEVFETIRLVRSEFPDKLICLSTNGIDLPQYTDTIAELGVSHVTLTINSLNPEILANIYSWVRFEKKMYRGIEAGELIKERQIEALQLLKGQDIIVKINTIIIPGVNDHEVENIASAVAALGADIMNCIPMLPNKDTAFECIPEPTKQTLHEIKKKISNYIKPMEHCSRCRADAAGLLGQDIEGSMELLKKCATMPMDGNTNRHYVAVASHEGMLVNQHLGEVTKFYIYASTTRGYKCIDERSAPPAGSGDIRWVRMAKVLIDCRAVLVSGAGPNPSFILKNMGLKIIQMNGLIEAGLDAVFKGSSIAGYQSMSNFKCGDSCHGDGQGCG